MSVQALIYFLNCPFISQGPSVDCDKRNIHEQRMYPTVKKKEAAVQMFLLEVFVINQLGKVSTFSGGLKWTHSFSASIQDSVLRWLPMFYSNQREWAVYFVCLNIHFHVEQVSLVVLWGTLTLREDFKWFVWPHVQQTLSFSLFFFPEM